MRNPSGYGCVKKLSGNRRKPYCVIPYQPAKTNKKKCREEIQFLKDYISEDLFKAVEKEYLESKAIPVTRQNQKPIGYYATRKEALIALAEYNRNPYDLDKANTTFEQIYNKLYEEKYSKMKKNTKYVRTVAFKKFTQLHTTKIRDINLASMQSIIDDNKELSISTQQNMITLCREIFSFACKNDLAEKDYSQFLEVSSEKKPKGKTAFSPEEIQLLWDSLDVPFADSVVILLYTGLRISELLAIKKEDVHFDEKWIMVEGTKTANAKRIVPIHPSISELIKSRLEMNSAYLVGYPDKKITYAHYKDRFYELCSTLNLDHTIHETRHSFATYSINMDKTIRAFIIGHSNKNITDDTYTDTSKLIPELLTEIEKYNPLR